MILEPAAKAMLDEMLADLKAREEWVRISPSKLVSWIVENYRNSFESNREAIIRAHFNSREYLKNVLQGLDAGENVADALQAALLKIGQADVQPSRQRGRKKRKLTETPPSGDLADSSDPSQEKKT